MNALNKSKWFIFFFTLLIFSSVSQPQNRQFKGEQIYDTKTVFADTHIVSVNRINLIITNNGSIGYSTFEESGIIYSSGIYISGITNDTLWANGIFRSDYFNDYQPGPVGSDPDDLLNRIYVVKSSDPAFGASWQNWSDAVMIGADYYDGNLNGIYDPVDLNGNGEWDEDEDRADLIGDETAWCVYNDGVLPPNRTFEGEPRSIEVHQSVFGFSTSVHNLNNVLFIRYRIYNKSYADWDTVYFTSVADPDIGFWGNDLGGCDSLLNLGYAYNDGEEDTLWYGANPPAFGVNLLQGCAVYIPRETFIDNNQNGVYDPGIDTPLDTAVYRYGQVMGIEEFPGAKNTPFNSFTNYISSSAIMGSPQFIDELRDYQLGGYNQGGLQIDVCNWPLGNGDSLANCDEINPKYMYSGDPVNGEGWLNILKTDQRIMVNTGPFTVKHNESLDIIVSYLVGRGIVPLEGVTRLKAVTVNSAEAFYNNFVGVPVSVDYKTHSNYPESFQLFQNYPNPFNPKTIIRYIIPKATNVKLEVFNLLGEKVQTMLDEFKNPGFYETGFDGSSITTGIYFYKLSAGSSVCIKKMVLLQ